MFWSLIADRWLIDTLLSLPEVQAVFDDRIYRDQAPEGTPAPVLIVTRVADAPSQPLGQPVTSWTFDYDVAGWDEGLSVARIAPAMDAIDAALTEADAAPVDGHHVTCWELSELPAAPPPRTGEPPSVRLGKTYRIYVS